MLSIVTAESSGISSISRSWQPVVALDRRPVAARHSRERLARQRGQRSRALYESITQTTIPKLCTAKLLLRPAITFQTLGQAQRARNDRFDTSQALAEISLQRIHIDGFDALDMVVLAVLATAPLGLSDLDPVGRLIAGAGKALAFHKAFDQPWPVAVLLFEIQINPAQHHSQHT